MEIREFTASNWPDYKVWLSNRSPQIDIYYTSSFLEIEAELTRGEQRVFVVEDRSGKYMVYPFILRKIPVKGFEHFFDASSPYGYCGPFWSSKDTKFKRESENMVCEYLRASRVMNEFVRYHYLYNEDVLFENNIVNSLNRKVVLVDLSKDWADVWEQQFSPTNRNLIRRMEKAGYQFFQTDSEDLYQSFINLYYETMGNVEADDLYYFYPKYFEKLRNQLGSELKLFVVTRDDILFNAALFFDSTEIATYYLSARNLHFPKIPATNFLLGNVIKSFCAQDKKYFNLGGGTALDDSNTLFKFKKNFSAQTKNFFIGKRIHFKREYEELKIAYASLCGADLMEKRSHLLQFYHS